MDQGFDIKHENPKQKANILSKLVFFWMGKIFYKGVKRGINVGDLTHTLDTDNSKMLGDKLQKNWEKQLAKSKEKNSEPSLVKAIADTFLWNYMIWGVLLFIQYVGLKTFQPLVLAYLLRLFTGAEKPENPELEKYITGLILIVVVALAVVLQHHTNFGQQSVGMRVRISVSTLVYRKMLRLSKKSLGETAAGKVVNLLANDVQRFDFVAIALHFFWIAPFQVAAVTYFLWDQVGVACLAGIGSMILLTLPLQVIMGKLTSKLRGIVAVKTDRRVKLMNEIISGIQVIKMYAWEKPFEKLVQVSRITEVTSIKNANYVRGVFLSSMVFVERTTLYLTLITYVLTDNQLSSDVVYSLTQYFSLLQLAMAIFIPLAIQMTAESLISIGRLKEFLLMDERQVKNLQSSNDKSIDITKVNASWTPEYKTLSDINLNIPAGSLCAIVGPVGSGKSSILQLLLGELPADTGDIKVGGSVSYSSQEPWLFGSSVRGNILFGQEYDKQLYNKVVQVCALEKDFKQFPQGDKTMVGERGVSLSGGQRARINLARAVYRSADIYIMDDPLSAVDTHVGKHLFDECIMTYLSSKTRILVTHQLQFLKKADIIVVLNNGKVDAQGTFAELAKSELDFTKMLVAADETNEKDPSELEKTPKALRNRLESVTSVASTATGGDDDEVEVRRADEEILVPGRSASIDYIKAAGSFCMLFTLGLVILTSQVACSGADYWVSYWTKHIEIASASRMANSTGDGRTNPVYSALHRVERATIHMVENLVGTSSDLSYNIEHSRANETNIEWLTDNIAIYIYSGLIIIIILFTIARSYLFFKCASNASKNLHAKMFNCLLKTPMRFFDTNPSGRILNRFSKDTGAMDEMLPKVLSEAIQILLVMCGSLVLISIANIWMLIAIAVLVVVFLVLRRWFLVTAKSIKHVEGIAKSPVFSLLNSTLNGISTIRASQAEMSLIEEFDRHQNVHTSAWFFTISAMVSFGLWLDILCVIFLAAIIVSFIAVSETSDVSGAMVGLAISQSLGLTGMLQHGMRQTAEVVNQLTSVERVLQYTKLDEEGPFETPEDKKPPKDWPSEGAVKFKKMYLKYSPEDPPVLKDLNIEIKPSEKIGIVGRTGAGKSSMMSALFRLAPLEGEISIDNYNANNLGLHQLRSKISIIPQEPVLFSAPMRYNLDPFEEYSDIDLWNALEEVELKEAVPSLDFKVEEGGSNFSVGQRQLICLARAIIRNNKILVMDEATANVDPQTFQPLVLAYLLRLFTGAEKPENPELEKYITGLILIVVVALAVVLQHHTNFGQQSVGMRVRISVSTLVYRKMLRLSKKSLGETAAGKVVNLLANDVQRFDFVAIALHFFWIAPFQVAAVTYFLWDQVGVACLAGIGSMILLTLPLQVIMGKLTSKLRGIVAVKTDRRVKLMNEIISGIQVIKMYAWEKPFEKLVQVSRITEVTSIKNANYVRGVFLSSMVFVERTTLYLTLITYVLTDNQLSSDVVYSLTQYFSLLQLAMAIFIPLAIQMTAESLISIGRLKEFLLMDERQVKNLQSSNDKSIDITKVNASWTPEYKTLSDINLNIPAGSLCAIVGPVGSGKSSILQLLLGELPADTGDIKVGGSISYSSQEPWLFGSSVRGNILFGQEYDKQLYNKVVQVCALEKDFKQFPQGDKTMVGERGVSLSGGQRARINLARAVYRSADIYIMDDPLSAVDTHVGKHLFDECIMTYLSSKTRILVTHQLQFLKKADIIVVLNNGKVDAQGTFAELAKSELDFTKMLVAADETNEKDPAELEKTPKALRNRLESVTSVASTATGGDDDEVEVRRADEEILVPGRSASIDYIKAAGSFCMLFTLGLVILTSQVACSGADYWVSYWTKHIEIASASRMANSTGDGRTNPVYSALHRVERATIHMVENLVGTSSDLSYNIEHSRANETNIEWLTDNIAIYIYSGLIIIIILFTIARSYLFFKCASNASKNLHAKMFNCLLKTPMRFFDTNPSGRILNRFSKDTGAMDEMLPKVLSEAIQILLVMCGSLVLISIANIWMLIAIAVLVVVFLVLRRWFLVTAKSIKHVEGIAKSPVFSLLNSTLNGISTIRASQAEMSLIEEFDRHQNVHTSAWFFTISAMVSFGLWLDILCVIFLAAIIVSFIAVSETSDVSGAMVGLAISQSLGLTGMLQHGMRQTAEVVNQLTSVERVLQYTKLDEEGPFETPEDKKPPKDWPSEGAVKFKKMYLKYSPEDPPVLKDLNIEIKPSEKIGIVGRTGAGKSSMMSALFRLAPLEGEISIDNYNANNLGLHQLRSKISIIPQEPVLFSAPMRYNLDPFEEYSDIDLWNALEEVELKEAVPSLDFKVEEGGSNFSVGQRQLICLARAIIRNNKILVMDEATANVDPQTDGLIQGTIRKKFKACTVLTIAHRLNTIMDSDRVLVMDSGRVVEYDRPHLLLQNSDGYFTKMVEETGENMTKSLREIARITYENRHKPSETDEVTKL